jgi:hypothetical protein
MPVAKEITNDEAIDYFSGNGSAPKSQCKVGRMSQYIFVRF